MSIIAPNETVTLSIDGQQVTTDEGKTVLQAALDHGIYIPHLCAYEGTTPYAGCRLCLVEVGGSDTPDTACTIPAKNGLHVKTNTPGVRQLQRQVLQLMLTEHPDRCLNCIRLERCPPFVACQRDVVVTDRCMICPNNRNCDLQHLVDFLGRPQQWVIGPRTSREPETSNPYIERNEDYCIYCTRCVRVCDEVMGIAALGVASPKTDPHVVVDFETEYKDTNCILCGSCAMACPVGAIVKVDKKYAPEPDGKVVSVCSYCGMGCGITIETEGPRIARVSPRKTGSSIGALCVRGHFWYGYAQSPERLTTPLVRDASGNLAPVTWDEALDGIASELAGIRQKYGPDSIGFLSAGKGTNEEAYLLHKLSRYVVGTNNLDQLPTGSTAAATVLKERLGYAASTASLVDLENAGCVLVVSADPSVTHPILAQQVWQALKHGAKIVVINSDETDLLRYAHLSLRPNLDTVPILLNGILRAILDAGLDASEYLQERAGGLDALKASLAGYDVSSVSQTTRVPVEDILCAARMLATGGREGYAGRDILWEGSTAVEPRSAPITDGTCIILGGDAITAQVALNIALVTGNVGKPGGGILLPLSENNSQGTSDMGVSPNWGPGYGPLGIAGGPDTPGLGFDQMLQAAQDGRLRALVVVGGRNPSPEVGDFQPASKPLQAIIARAKRDDSQSSEVAGLASKLELLATIGAFRDAIAAQAHFVLPGAVLAEKEGTITNLERRVQVVHPVVAPPGDARLDWSVLCDLAKRLQSSIAVSGGFEFDKTYGILAEIAKVAPAYQGLHPDLIAGDGAFWPVSSGGDLYSNAFPIGKARLEPAG